MRTLKQYWPHISFILLVGAWALAQQVVLIKGMDGTSVPRTALTDTKGKLVVTLGGAGSNVTTLPAQCATASVQTAVTVDTTVGGTAVPTAQTANRAYVVICNSKVNSAGLIKCLVNGSAPIYASGAGDVLDIGDCIPYAVAAGVTPKCIASAGSLTITSFECVP
jgi:hypothetical protein